MTDVLAMESLGYDHSLWIKVSRLLVVSSHTSPRLPYQDDLGIRLCHHPIVLSTKQVNLGTRSLRTVMLNMAFQSLSRWFHYDGSL